MDGFNVVRASIPANHMDMARFSSRQDIGYQRVLGYLTKLAKGTDDDAMEADRKTPIKPLRYSYLSVARLHVEI